MRIIFVILQLLLVHLAAYSQKVELIKDSNTEGYIYSEGGSVKHIRGKKFEGYIFSKECSSCGLPPNIEYRYTSSTANIVDAEKILLANADTITNLSIRLFSKKEAIEKRKLKKYKRQYWGTLSAKGDSIICIQFSEELIEGMIEEIKEGVISYVYDGGTSCFFVAIDLKNKKIIEIQINGVA